MMTKNRLRSVAELQDLAAMCREALEINTDPADRAKLTALLAEHEEQIARRQSGGHVREVREDDGVDGSVRDSLGRRRAPSGQGGAHIATDKQVNFLRKLIAEKSIDGLTIPATLTNISKKSCSALIDQLLDRPAKATAAAPVRVASGKQLDLIKRLLSEKELTGTNFEGTDADIAARDSVLAVMTPKQASECIDKLFKLQRKVTVVAKPLESGMYRVGERIFKVYWNQGQTRMLAKLLVLGEDGEDATWDYQGMASRFVKAEQRMSLEDAKAFGVIYGVCCSCGRTLTDEGSIAAGIGPVCATKGWA